MVAPSPCPLPSLVRAMWLSSRQATPGRVAVRLWPPPSLLAPPKLRTSIASAGCRTQSSRSPGRSTTVSAPCQKNANHQNAEISLTGKFHRFCQFRNMITGKYPCICGGWSRYGSDGPGRATGTHIQVPTPTHASLHLATHIAVIHSSHSHSIKRFLHRTRYSKDPSIIQFEFGAGLQLARLELSLLQHSQPTSTATVAGHNHTYSLKLTNLASSRWHTEAVVPALPCNLRDSPLHYTHKCTYRIYVRRAR